MTIIAVKGRIRCRYERNFDRGEAARISILAMVVLWSACAGGGDSVDSQPIPDLGLPRRLADDFPAQQGLDTAPVEKAPRQGEPARPSRDDDDMIINVGAHARVSIPFGTADRNYSNNYYYGYYYVTSYTSWADVFNPG